MICYLSFTKLGGKINERIEILEFHAFAKLHNAALKMASHKFRPNVTI